MVETKWIVEILILSVLVPDLQRETIQGVLFVGAIVFLFQNQRALQNKLVLLNIGILQRLI